MKLEVLTLHNLASITDATIDFTQPPLADSEVFLITGKTGSGKSTLLDAICLALFADTPRLENTRMEGEVEDGGEKGKSIRLKDTRQLMRHGTGDCYSRLTFTGSNGIRYQATWSVARAHGKPSGTIQSKRWTLENLDNGTTLTKEADIRAEMKQAIGLDFTQFLRTTLLAQGEFTQFLNSRDNDKAEILEKITGGSVYKDIGKKVYELTEQHRREWDAIQRQLQTLQLLEPEEENRLTEQLSACEKQSVDLRTTYSALQSKLNWLITNRQLTKNKEDATNEWKQAEAELHTSAFEADTRMLSLWDETADVRQWISSLDEQTKSMRSMDAKRSHWATMHASFTGGEMLVKAEAERIKRESDHLHERIQKEQEHADMYVNAKQIVHLLTDFNETKTLYDSLSIQLKESEEIAEQKLMPAYRQLSEQHKNILKEIDDATNRRNELQQQLVNMRLDALRQEKDQIQTLLSNMAVTQERWRAVEKEKKLLEEARRQVDVLSQKTNELNEQIRHLEPGLSRAEAARTATRNLYDRQLETVSRWARTVRSKLRVGDTCPVCRQRIQAALPDEEVLDSLLIQAETAVKEAENAYDSLSRQLNTLCATRSVVQQQATEAELKVTHQDALQKAVALLQESFRACGIDDDSKQNSEVLQALQSECQKRLEQLTHRIKQGEQLERAIKTATDAITVLNKKCEEVARSLTSAEKKVQENKQKTVALQGLKEDKDKYLHRIQQDLFLLLKPMTPDADMLNHPLELAKNIEAQSASYEKMCRQFAQLSQSLATMDELKSKVTAVLLQLDDIRTFETDTVEAKPHPVEALLEDCLNYRAQLQAWTEHRQATEHHIGELRQQIEHYVDSRPALSMERLTELAHIPPGHISALRQRQTQLRNLALTRRTLLEACTRQLTAHQEQAPHFDQADTEENLTLKIREAETGIKSLDEQKGAIQASLKRNGQLRQRAAALVEEAKAKKEVYDRWSRLNQLIGDAQGVTFRKIAQSYVLQSLIHSANTYLRHLTDRYQLQVTPGTFVISIIDAYQGYATRSSSTISGGESFLVSLSLALALSDIGKRLSVDTLFIDEGFGTLSGEPLQRAIDTLRSLHTKVGRHVGIISHVDELRERIPCQIQVIQEGRNSSSTVSVTD